jgi:hypothetical protein
LIDRRGVLTAALAAVAGFLAAPVARAHHHLRQALASDLEEALEKSPYVYVSPLLASGGESTCHGEVWYAWLDGAVFVIVAADGWKAKSLAAGRDRARLWVGDHGRWNKGANESFRKGPHVDVRGEGLRDAEMVERVLSVYDVKYPDGIGKWRDRMKNGVADGSRVLIRYVPDRSSRT